MIMLHQVQRIHVIQTFLRGLRDNTAGWELSLHAVNKGSIRAHYRGSQNLPAMIAECRAKSKP